MALNDIGLLVSQLRDGTYINYAKDACDDVTLCTLITEQAKHSPDSIAVLACDGQLSYQSLIENTSQWVDYLQSKGVVAGDRVGICIERTVNLIPVLLGVLQTLVELGNTVLIIEHNLDIIKVADHIIDIGPEGGKGGGEVVFEGSPEKLIKHKTSYTGKFLRAEFN